MNYFLLVILTVGNLPVFGMLASTFFGDDGLDGAVRYLFIPSLLSAFKGAGEFIDDRFMSAVFPLWIICCLAVVWAEYQAVRHWLPGVFAWVLQWNDRFVSLFGG